MTNQQHTGSGAKPLLSISGLTVRYSTNGDDVIALDDIDFEVFPGERVAIIGESGSGKSTITQALLGILAPNSKAEAREADFDGVDLFSGLTEREWNQLRRTRVAYVPQDPNIALNPVRTIGKQLTEAIKLARGSKVEKVRLREDAVELLLRVGLNEPDRVLASYPHQISGGQRQRVLIAIALVGEPKLIIADEPTSGLDVTVQKTVLDALDQLVVDTGVGLLLVTHDLGVASNRSDRIVVLQNGKIVERGLTPRITTAPEHSYTKRLLDAVPSVDRGRRAPSSGVERAVERRSTGKLEVDRVEKTYVTRDARRGKQTVHATRGVSFVIEPGQTYGLVGESGSGKSTIGRIIAGIERPDEGAVRFDGVEIAQTRGEARRQLHTRVQYVFQNPYTSLDPKLDIFDIIAEPLRGFAAAKGEALAAAVAKAGEAVGLNESFLGRKPTELSGGQRQRVAIARSVVLRPELIVLDEPVSALDVSVQAQILQLLVDLQHEFGIAYLFISHDLAVIRELSDRVGVLRAGELVEEGSVDEVFANPQTDYTRLLIDAIPALSHA